MSLIHKLRKRVIDVFVIVMVDIDIDLYMKITIYYHSDLLGLIAGFSCRIVGIFNVCVGACAVGVLDEDVKVVLAVDQNLVLYHSTLL